MIICHVGPLWGLLGTHGGPKTAPTWPRIAQNHQNGSKWHCITPNGPSGPKTVLRGIIYDYMPCWLPMGPFRYPRGPKGPLFGPKRAEIGPKLKIVVDLSCDLSKFAQEGHSANEKNIIIIWCTSSEKIPKNIS